MNDDSLRLRERASNTLDDELPDDFRYYLTKMIDDDGFGNWFRGYFLSVPENYLNGRER